MLSLHLGLLPAITIFLQRALGRLVFRCAILVTEHADIDDTPRQLVEEGSDAVAFAHVAPRGARLHVGGDGLYGLEASVAGRACVRIFAVGRRPQVADELAWRLVGFAVKC